MARVTAIREVPTAKEETNVTATISPPKIRTAVIKIVGIAPYVQHKFSAKSRAKIEATHRAGSQSKSKKVREARNFDEEFEGAIHYSKEGWMGIPSPGIRAALISACRLVGFQMTKAKLSIFVVHDGIDAEDATPLTRINGKPEPHMAYVRNDSGVVDLRCRPMWHEWTADVKLRWDEDQFSAADVINLLSRAGLQVGIGEGRPDSKNSTGQGWGVFEVASD
jgi:hypothetical protein